MWNMLMNLKHAEKEFFFFFENNSFLSCLLSRPVKFYAIMN